ncbi:alpha/beta hydrolase [Cellulomonas endophytica]|uniref:alpha/beta hydrolase n=1 Tax=Cellulomonas endophytica TaxID=2494735 RepID=UPI0010131076|nr:alpha/beta hydrolase fold domain-containing protein [Cellulomonas endophytica]
MRTEGPVVLPTTEGVEDASFVFPRGEAVDGRTHVRNVGVATLTAYLPEPGRATGTGVVVAPGGALHFLSVDNEGVWVARRLVEQGVAAFVLRYRTVPSGPDVTEWEAMSERAFTDMPYMTQIGREYRAVAAADGGAAVALVRERAQEWGVRPDRVGLLGFSAGGFVAAVTTLDAPPEGRPDFVAPVYPALWGSAVVPEPAPPMFLAWASDDGLGEAITGSAVRLYTAWLAAGASVEAHAYARGGHGFGAAPQSLPSDRWFDDLVAWMRSQGLVDPLPAAEAQATR